MDRQDPLALLTPVQLWNVQITLQRGCGRSRASLREKRRQYYCLAARTFKIEADLRGLPSPPPDASWGQMKDDPDYPPL